MRSANFFNSFMLSKLRSECSLKMSKQMRKLVQGVLIAAKALSDNYGTTSQSEKSKHASRFVQRSNSEACWGYRGLWASRDVG